MTAVLEPPAVVGHIGAPADGVSAAPRPFRIAFGLPTCDQVDAGFAVSLAKCFALCAGTLVADGIADIEVFRVADTLLDRGRMTLVQHAMNWKATHLFWVDSDMEFPADAVHQLLARNQDIVGANYASRRPPYSFTAIRSFGNQDLRVPVERCKTLDDATGIEAVAALGFGCLLTRMGVFYDLAPPVFHTHYELDKKRWVGEDVTFAQAATAAGYTLYVDHDLSKQVGHAGRFVYRPTHSTAVAGLDSGIVVTER